MIGKYRFKPGVGKHMHHAPDGSFRYLTPGEVIDAEQSTIEAFAWKFDVLVPPPDPNGFGIGPRLVEIGKGYYDLFDAQGNRMNDRAVTAEEAMDLLQAGAAIEAGQ